MERTNKKSKKKQQKEKVKEDQSTAANKKTPEGIPDVDFKKFLGCG